MASIHKTSLHAEEHIYTRQIVEGALKLGVVLFLMATLLMGGV
jgi:hypothetical protein